MICVVDLAVTAMSELKEYVTKSIPAMKPKQEERLQAVVLLDVSKDPFEPVTYCQPKVIIIYMQ